MQGRVRVPPRRRAGLACGERREEREAVGALHVDDLGPGRVVASEIMGTESLTCSGSGVKWTSGGAERRCDRALWRPRTYAGAAPAAARSRGQRPVGSNLL